MKVEFVIQVAFHAPRAPEAEEPVEKHAQARHEASPPGLAKRARMPEIRSQFAASAASCLLPALVME